MVNLSAVQPRGTTAGHVWRGVAEPLAASGRGGRGGNKHSLLTASGSIIFWSRSIAVVIGITGAPAVSLMRLSALDLTR